MKRLLSWLLVAVICLAGLHALAEPLKRYDIGDAIEYQTGVIARGTTADFMLFARLDELEIAYLDCDQPYLTKGVPATWTVMASGGWGDYEFVFSLFYRSGNSGPLFCCDRQEQSSAASFTHTPVYSSGQYLLKVQLIDETGKFLEWNSPIFETSAPADKADASTVPGKVAQLAAQCMSAAGDNDFSRALWLHDWLTSHAEYDLTYTYYFPEGVLLRGKGVCQSYALAYGMLLKEVGIESLYITGQAGGEDHAWNLVKLSGNWYHVDCTWDDPVGGSETHAYFALTDAQIAKDHTWAQDDGILPACTATDCAPDNMLYVTNTATAAQGMEKLQAAVQARADSLYLVFPDARAAADFSALAQEWAAKQVAEGNLEGLLCDDLWNIYAIDDIIYQQEWDTPETGLRLCYLHMDYGEGYHAPENAVYAHFITASAVLKPGQTLRPSLYLVPQDGAGLTWQSSDPAVASVAQGEVTAHAPGSSVITVTLADGSQTQCRVYVLGDERVVIPAQVLTIESEAFSGSTAMQVLVLEDGVTTIGERAFADCAGLVSAWIPASVTSIAADAFSGCPNLTILCPDGSAAARFAQSAGIPYRSDAE